MTNGDAGFQSSVMIIFACDILRNDLFKQYSVLIVDIALTFVPTDPIDDSISLRVMLFEGIIMV